MNPLVIVTFVIAVLLIAAAAVLAFYGARCKYKTDAQDVSEEEIRSLVTENEELQDDEKRMIHEIINLGDMRAEEAMQPRVDMILVQDNETVRQAADRMRGTGFSRLPVYHEDYDHIIGIVHFKDLVPALLDGQSEDNVGDYAYQALFVPETKDLIPLLTEMRDTHQQMAIVVDEYGGTGGLITIEDIVEEIVGEIADESDQERGFLRVTRKDQWVADGRLPVEEALSLGWPVEESDDYETLAGWLLTKFESVPQAGDMTEVDNFTFKIEGMRRRRIQRVRVTKVV
ncbi:MAG: hemolysin family protein [Coriobacteriia bacterium]|nr:hemolysin family protein [Coriobacteriia bacterium]